MVFVAGQDLAVTAVKPLADEEILFGSCGGRDPLCGFEETLADLNGALGGGSAFIPRSRDIDRVQANGGRVDVHGSLRQTRGQVEDRDARGKMRGSFIDGFVVSRALPKELRAATGAAGGRLKKDSLRG